MILDLHVHTDLSGDAKPTIVEYARWAKELQELYSIHGFVVAEHRYYSMSRNPVLAELSRETGLVILQSVELETDYGHLLIYGVNQQFLDRVDVTQRTDGLAAAQAAVDCGAIAVPAHPCRPMLGSGDAVSQLPGIYAIEQLNGANERGENRQAEILAKSLCLFSTGGSDAHYVSDFGFCMTRFERNFSTDKELVAELKMGNYRAIYLEESRHS